MVNVKESFSKITGLYTEYKLWLRSSPTGMVIDRAVRFFVITAVSLFFTNFVIGAQVLPVLQTSIAAALVATFDKVKNEWFAKQRAKEQKEFTVL